MTARWERIAAPPEPEGPLFMDAVLTPNRSLSRQAFLLVMAGFVFANAVAATFFMVQGAYPVSGFLGLDVLALLWAFRMNYRAGRAMERVRVGGGALLVSRRPPDRAETFWAVSPYFARVVDDPAAVCIAAGGRNVRVGGFLSPPERRDFARALTAALARARQSASTSRIE